MGAAPVDVKKLASGLRGGDRRALARAITLVKSTRADHRGEAEKLLALLLPEAGKSMRLGISGRARRRQVDLHRGVRAARSSPPAIASRCWRSIPRRKRGGGSILGDKTRMAELASE